MEEIPIVPNAQEAVSIPFAFISPETSISRLGLSPCAFNALTKSGYDTVAKVLRAYPGIRPGRTGIRFRQTILAQANSTRL